MPFPCLGGSGKKTAKPKTKSQARHGLTPEEAEEEPAGLQDLAKGQAEAEAARHQEEARARAQEAAKLLAAEAEAARRQEQEAAELQERQAEEESRRRTAQAKADAGTQDVLVRKEIRKMLPKEQQRFCKALMKLMENKDGEPQTSEYFNIAGYHGWPSGLGHSGEETFPGWHRGYLVTLERALAEADTVLGNNGDLGLPYWDWLDGSQDGEFLPKCIRDAFPTLPDGLLDPEQAGHLGRLGFSHLASDSEIRSFLRKSSLDSIVSSCLSGAPHWLHASKRGSRRGHSLEAVLDLVRTACGFPLNDAAYAAFHPCFFLVQSNLDRLYERFLQLEGHEECGEDFRRRQEQLRESAGEPDRFAQALDPFKHPFKRRPLLPADTLSTVELGYVYDELPPAPLAPAVEDTGYRKQETTPLQAAFRGVSAACLQDRSYALHVFALHKGAGAAWTPPEGDAASWEALPEYVGCGAALGGHDSKAASKSVNVLVEVQKGLDKLHLGLHDTELRVLCVDQLGAVVPLEDTPLPLPLLLGPFFEDPTLEVQDGDTGGDVSQLHHRLAVLGYDPGEADGAFGPQLRAAVERFQEFNGLKPDGVAGAVTKERLTAQRKDIMPDSPIEARQRFVEGETVHYAVLGLPRHLELHRKQALEEIARAFKLWGEAMNVTFAQAEDGGPPASVSLRFEDLSEQGAHYHGGLALPRGQLAEVSQAEIVLDVGEHWLLKGQEATPRRPQAVRLSPVLLHQVGHFLGLPHSTEYSSVMWPYYEHLDEEPGLSESDKALARSMVKGVGPCGCELQESPGCSLQ